MDLQGTPPADPRGIQQVPENPEQDEHAGSSSSSARPRHDWQRWRPTRGRSRGAGGVRQQLLTAAELAALLLWTLIVTRPYLNLDPNVVPAGREFLTNIQTLHIWNWMRECGACAFWFGGANGGWPVAADVNASTFHPLVAAATLGWGVLNGSKITLACCFFLAGLAQWWLARVLGLGRIARLWTACMAVVAGSLASRMALGSLGMILSTATSAFVWPPLILLSRTGRRREAAWLAIALGSLLLAGNGYMQVGVALTAPATLILLGKERLNLLPRYLLAAGIALLLAAPMLIPYLHFLPEFAKEFQPGFTYAQPFAYVPLNLVINDRFFYQTEALGKLSFVFMYALFIGWVPVLLAAWGLGGAADRARRRVLVFLAVLVVLALWLGSGGPLRLLTQIFPFRAWVLFLEGLRYPSYMAGLAVSPILGLAGVGLDRLLNASWPRLQLGLGAGTALSVSLRWLLAIPLVLAPLSAWNFISPWIAAQPQEPEIRPVVAALRTKDAQWVSTPYGEGFWIEAALEEGLKVTNHAYLTWHWRERRQPDPVLVASRTGDPPGMTRRSAQGQVGIYEAAPGNEYAAVTSADGRRTVCAAQAKGGNIDVLCDTAAPGVLTVKENGWTGWSAATDRGKLALLPGRWLAVALPAGHSQARFRYRPWDLPLGLFLCLCGAVFCVREIVRGREREDPVLISPAGRESSAGA